MKTLFHQIMNNLELGLDVILLYKVLRFRGRPAL